MRQGIAEYQKRPRPGGGGRPYPQKSRRPHFSLVYRGRDALLPAAGAAHFLLRPKKRLPELYHRRQLWSFPAGKGGRCPEDQLFSAYLSASAGPGAPLRAALPCLLHQCRCQVPQITTSSPELLQASGFFFTRQNVSRETFVREQGWFGRPAPPPQAGSRRGGKTAPPARRLCRRAGRPGPAPAQNKTPASVRVRGKLIPGIQLWVRVASPAVRSVFSRVGAPYSSRVRLYSAPAMAASCSSLHRVTST